MNIPDAKLPLVRKVIHGLYSEDFSEKTVLNVASSVGEVIDGHYFALLLFPNKYAPRHLLLSNNPQDFLKVYVPLLPKDFFIQHLVDTAGIAWYRNLKDWALKTHRCLEFLDVCQAVRPMSDCILVPLKINGYLAGYWALGRAELSSPLFSVNDAALFSFLSGFLRDSFVRTLYVPPVPEEETVLDLYGRVLSAGLRARTVFTELFGEQYRDNPGGGNRFAHTQFRNRYRQFLRGPRYPGCGDLTLHTPLRSYTLSFTLIDWNPYRIHLPREPQVKVTVRPDGPAPDEGELLDIPFLVKRYGFSARETDVIRGVYRGFTNKDIGITLGIEEATVKRHVYNIFEKTGVGSRALLVLKLGTEEKGPA